MTAAEHATITEALRELEIELLLRLAEADNDDEGEET
jgi:hypothetical protein